MLWTFLMVRFAMDVSACIMFLRQFFFFLKIKVEKLIEDDRDLTGFHKFVRIPHPNPTADHTLYHYRFDSGVSELGFAVIFRPADLNLD